MKKILKAINYATLVHRTQTRKGKPDVPYITHPMSVGLLLARAGAEDDIIVAGILHDTIEDCVPFGSITKETIEKEFGKQVAEMVNDVSEQDPSLPWYERKKLALEHIPHMKKESVFVKSADVLHNMSDQIEDYKKDGEKTMERFSAPKEQQLKRYINIVTVLAKAWPENPIMPELQSALEEIKQLWK